MSDNTFRVHVDLRPFMRGTLPARKDIFPSLAYALQQLAYTGQERWRGYAMGKPMPNGHVIHPRTGQYARSIKTRAVTDFHWEIYSDCPYADAIEQGSPARNMKRMLDTSFKVRMSKKGKRYLIIPFRHGTPGAVGFTSTMDENIHGLWRGLQSSRVKAMSARVSGTGAWDVRTRRPMQVPQRVYDWGQRLTVMRLQQAGATMKQINRMRGMVHMQGAGGKHGQYLTFRTMTEDSRGWQAKATPGKWPARQTSERLRKLAREVIPKAVERDFDRLLGRVAE